MSVVIADLTVRRDGDFIEPFTLLNGNGAAINLSDYSFILSVSTALGLATPDYIFSSGNGGIDDSGKVSGEVVVTIPDQLITAGKYFYDLVGISADKTVILMKGSLTSLQRGVST